MIHGTITRQHTRTGSRFALGGDRHAELLLRNRAGSADEALNVVGRHIDVGNNHLARLLCGSLLGGVGNHHAISQRGAIAVLPLHHAQRLVLSDVGARLEFNRYIGVYDVQLQIQIQRRGFRAVSE